MKNGILTAAFVVSILLLAIFAVILPAAEAATGAECKAIKGTCAKSCSSTTQVNNDKMDCGTAGWFWKVQTTCCTKKSCSDGTPQGSCSTVDKPKYCNTGAKLVDLPSRCPCPDGLVKKGNKCVTPTPAPVKKDKCDDGTKLKDCSTTKPKWCNAAGSLIDSPKTCGCPDGQVYNKYSAKCVTSTPTTPIPSVYCSFMPEGTDCSGGGTCKGGKCVASTPAPTKTPCKKTDAGDSGKIKGTCTPATGQYCIDNKTVAGASCTDYCTSESSVKEYFCTSGAEASCGSSVISCPSGYTCSDGACRTAATPTPVPAATASCSDTDTTATGPGAYDVKGTCTDTGSTKICPYGCDDACASGNENKVGGQLNEYYCYSKRCYLKQESCSSTQMCSSGRCVASTAPTSTPTAVPTKTPTPAPTATPSCSDTDTTSTGTTAVFNYDVKGTCTDTGSTAVCASGCADVCQSSSEGVFGGTLNEYYCYAKRCYLKSYSCSSTQMCSSGACVPA